MWQVINEIIEVNLVVIVLKCSELLFAARLNFADVQIFSATASTAHPVGLEIGVIGSTTPARVTIVNDTGIFIFIFSAIV